MKIMVSALARFARISRIAVAEGCDVSNSGQDWDGIVASRCKALIVVTSEPGRRNAQRVVDTDRRGSLNMAAVPAGSEDRKSTRLNSSHVAISYAVFCLKKKK